jgi:NADH-quinone oxidoreductase subunit C
MKPSELLNIIEEEFGDFILESSDEGFDPYIVVEPDALRDISFFLRDDERMKFDFLRTLVGMDKIDFIESLFVLFSYTHRHQIIVKVEANHKNPEVDTVSDIWKAANWYERESYDLVGITYKGHPDLRRLMMPQDWVGHPLLKDYKQPKVYHGMDLYRFNPVLKIEDKKAKKK